MQSLFSWHNEGKIFVNRRYQRKLVWTLEEKQRLIESILKKYPIPAVLFAERKPLPGTYEIIDGLQRVQAIIAFIEMAFPTMDGRYFDVAHFPTAKSRADKKQLSARSSSENLNSEEIGYLLDYALSISIMRNATEAEIDDVFDRINTYGKRLSDQERRQSGVQNQFSKLVRNIGCVFRGDSSEDVIPLEIMPEISIDLPKSKHGYTVQSDEVFWVKQGILRSTDLRDSMDEQCIADIAACLIGGMLIERSKDALDKVYSPNDPESQRMETALSVYGSEKFKKEFAFCIDELINICSSGSPSKLRDIVFEKGNTNAFPSVFASLVIALHELIVKEKKSISNRGKIKSLITGISSRIATGRKATSTAERRKNINSIKGLIGDAFIEKDISSIIYGGHSVVDVEDIVRRSEVETSYYELKQGILRLDKRRKIDDGVCERLLKTICAIANNGPGREGKIVIGVSDKSSDAKKIKALDNVLAIPINNRFLVGIRREATHLGWSTERYFQYIKDCIANSDLSSPLKEDVLSNIDFNECYGLGVVIITIPQQKDISYLKDNVYRRSGDSVEEVHAPKDISAMTKRFLK
ncbi:MAG TPA: DUF262 domain-containing protein [Chthoniobacteraceae bacterium]|nr:DUF262 domain-containing protein [Chthoniobacteraceae bacterium]